MVLSPVMICRVCFVRDALKGKRRDLLILHIPEARLPDHLQDLLPIVHLDIAARKPGEDDVGQGADRPDAVHIVEQECSSRPKDPMHFIQRILRMRIVVDAHVAGHRRVLSAFKRHVLRISHRGDRVGRKSGSGLPDHFFRQVQGIELNIGKAFLHQTQERAWPAADIDQPVGPDLPDLGKGILIIVPPVTAMGQL